MIKHLICDLDNTLYSNTSGMLQAIDRRIDEFINAKLNMEQPFIATMRSEFLRKYGTTLTGLITHHLINPDEYLSYAYNIKVTDFIKPDIVLSRVLDGIDLRKVVFSNSPLEYVEEVLNVLKIRQYFHGIYDIRFCGFIGKPNQSSYQKALDDLQAQGEECLMVDDCPANLIQAQQLGMTPILLSTEPSPQFQWVIPEIHELGGLIPEILKGF